MDVGSITIISTPYSDFPAVLAQEVASNGAISLFQLLSIEPTGDRHAFLVDVFVSAVNDKGKSRIWTILLYLKKDPLDLCGCFNADYN
jgi:hypothetical protein